MTKTTTGNFFEDFRLGQTIRHATPRTVTVGDVALYNALFGARVAAHSSDPFAYAIAYPAPPLPPPRPLPLADLALYSGLFGARFAPQPSAPFAYAIGYPASPLDDLLV